MSVTNDASTTEGLQDVGAGRNPSSWRGVLVTVEGMDFAGKSTLARNLAAAMEDETDLRGRVELLREPGGTAIGERIRDMLLSPESVMGFTAEAYLYAAARAELVEKEIRPRIAQGMLVICDRFVDSSVAYQGMGRSLGIKHIQDLNALALKGLQRPWEAPGTGAPDLTLYLRLDSEMRLARAAERGTPLDRMEQAGDDFSRRASNGFDVAAARDSKRIKVLDARATPDELLEQAIELVNKVVAVRQAEPHRRVERAINSTE